MKCMHCEQQSEHFICSDCLSKFAENLRVNRERLFKSIAEEFDKKSSDIYENIDVTRGRGRGPKWLDS